MEAFSALLALCAGNSPVSMNSPHKGQWRGALMFSLICAWIYNWVNNREAGDLRRHRGHYDVIVMSSHCLTFITPFTTLFIIRHKSNHSSYTQIFITPLITYPINFSHSTLFFAPHMIHQTLHLLPHIYIYIPTQSSQSHTFVTIPNIHHTIRHSWNTSSFITNPLIHHNPRHLSQSPTFITHPIILETGHHSSQTYSFITNPNIPYNPLNFSHAPLFFTLSIINHQPNHNSKHFSLSPPFMTHPPCITFSILHHKHNHSSQTKTFITVYTINHTPHHSSHSQSFMTLYYSSLSPLFIAFSISYHRLIHSSHSSPFNTLTTFKHSPLLSIMEPGGRLNIKMPSYQYKDSHVKDKTVSPTVLSLTWKSPYID